MLRRNIFTGLFSCFLLRNRKPIQKTTILCDPAMDIMSMPLGLGKVNTPNAPRYIKLNCIITPSSCSFEEIINASS